MGPFRRPRQRPLPRGSAAAQGPGLPGRRTSALRGNQVPARPELGLQTRQRAGPAAARGRLRHRGQDEHAGAGAVADHRAAHLRSDAQPLGPGPHRGRFERRLGSGRGRGAGARGARGRRRRLDPQSCGNLRAGRSEAFARPQQPGTRAGRRLGRQRHRARDHPQRSRHRRGAGQRLGAGHGRSLFRAAPSACLSRRSRSRSRPPARREFQQQRAHFRAPGIEGRRSRRAGTAREPGTRRGRGVSRRARRTRTGRGRRGRGQRLRGARAGQLRGVDRRPGPGGRRGAGHLGHGRARPIVLRPGVRQRARTAAGLRPPATGLVARSGRR